MIATVRRAMARTTLAALVGFVIVFPNAARAGGKVGIYGVRQEPHGAEAEEFHDNNWGGGLLVVAPVPGTSKFLAGTLGVEYVHFDSRSNTVKDPDTGLRVERNTDQNDTRISLGAEAGAHGHGFFRPHGGIGISLIYYSISTTVTVPDDFDPDQSIDQIEASDSDWVWGYDVTLGVDLNFNNVFTVDGGVRYLKSFDEVQQLGLGAERITPEYFQIYLGLALTFEQIQKMGEDTPGGSQ